MNNIIEFFWLVTSASVNAVHRSYVIVLVPCFFVESWVLSCLGWEGVGRFVWKCKVFIHVNLYALKQNSFNTFIIHCWFLAGVIEEDLRPCGIADVMKGKGRANPNNVRFFSLILTNSLQHNHNATNDR